MRKILLGTTALMAAGALYAADAQAADPIKVGVGGFMTQRFGYATTDINPASTTNDYDGFDVKQDAEIIFSGSTKLDNGITIGVVVELEAAGVGGSSSYSGAQTASDQIDEEFLYVTGSFGRLEIGSTNTAAYKMAYRLTSAAGSLSTNEGTIPRWIRVPTGFSNADNTSPLLSNDRDQVTYYTPRWEGFQVGLSYVPSATEPQFTVTMPDRKSAGASLNDGFSAGLNFDRTFSGFKLQLAGVYETHQGRDGTTDDDATAWNLSGIVTYAGFSVGVAYLDQSYNGTAGATTSGNFDVWNVGVGYRFGATNITASYTNGEHQGVIATAGDDESTLWQVAASHDIGPGISVHGTIFGADWDNETGGVDTDGWGAVVGVTTRF